MKTGAAVVSRRPTAPTVDPCNNAETTPTQRDRHLQIVALHGRMAWRKVSSYNKRARVEAAIGRTRAKAKRQGASRQPETQRSRAPGRAG
jgi:hypothetical protein